MVALKRDVRTQVRLRAGNKITLPAAIVAAAKLAVGDVLRVSFVNSTITLVPLAAPVKHCSIEDFVGIGHGVWGASKQEVMVNICAERDVWER